MAADRSLASRMLVLKRLLTNYISNPFFLPPIQRHPQSSFSSASTNDGSARWYGGEFDGGTERKITAWQRLTKCRQQSLWKFVTNFSILSISGLLLQQSHCKTVQSNCNKPIRFGPTTQSLCRIMVVLGCWMMMAWTGVAISVSWKLCASKSKVP